MLRQAIMKEEKKTSFKETFVKIFCTYLAIELVEELLEELIAFGVTWVFTKALSTLAVIVVTQSGKTIIKMCFKRITYKEGNDKMKFISKAYTWIKGNYLPILGTASAAVTALSGTGVIDITALPALAIAGFNITPVLYYVIFGALSILGISKTGWQKIATYLENLDIKKAEKEDALADRTAKKRVKAEAKEAKLSQAAQEKKTAKEEAEKAKQEEKQKANDAFEAKVAARMAEIKKAQEETTTNKEASV